MTKASPLSMDQLTAVLDNAPVAVYVSAVKTHELLYANARARESILPDSGATSTACYEIAGFDRPCPFCHTGEMNRSQLLTREYRHPVTGRIYQLSGKLLDWDGVPAHIEYILDITEKKREEDRSKALKEELQATFSSIPCGLCVYRFDGRRLVPLFHNPAFYRIVGYSAEHIRSAEEETTFLGVHPDDLAPMQEKLQKVFQNGQGLEYTYRVWNDRLGEYRWIQIEGAIKPQEDGAKLLYGIFKDVSEQYRLERELTGANEKMQSIINAIPGGVAIYKVSDIFETRYFSDGVPKLTGYTVEEYRELIRRDAAEMTYWEDTPMVVAALHRAIKTHSTASFEFRKPHRDGHLVWVHIQAEQIGEEDGFPLIQCVFHNISDLKEAQSEMAHLVNSIPGGIASYRVEGSRLIPSFYSDGVPALSGHTREEFDQLLQGDAMNAVCSLDQKWVSEAVQSVLKSGETLDVSYRIRHKNGHLIWIHLNGRRLGPASNSARFYAVFTGMSAESRLFQNIASETADGVYIIDRETHNLLYVSERKPLLTKGDDCIGQKCYAALQDQNAPCEFCTLKTHIPDGEEHRMEIRRDGRFFATHFRETTWNGIPAYAEYIREITEEVKTRKEKERLEQYFQTVVKNLPGGVAVIRCEAGGAVRPEFLSDGFAAMTGMTLEEAWDLYRIDAMAGVHPDDALHVKEQMTAYISVGGSHCEIVYRLLSRSGGYIWVKNTLSLIQNEGGESCIYAFYHDITREREEREQFRRQYNDLIVQHYQMPGPNALIVGHCNITQNRILEIIDYTGSDPLGRFGSTREDFFAGLGSLITDPEERKAFQNTYQNASALAAFRKNDLEQIQECFVQLPNEAKGRYVRFRMNMVATPDSGDVTGILTVTDITQQTVEDRILHQMSVANCDLIADVDLLEDQYVILSGKEPFPKQGTHSQRIASLIQTQIIPKDRERTAQMLDKYYMLQRLQKEGAYSFSYSITGEKGEILTRNLTVSAVDLRLGRVCFARADITSSVREQQGLLNMIAYTFELACFIDLGSRALTMYTRKTVLQNLSPYQIDDYDQTIEELVRHHCEEEDRQNVRNCLLLEHLVEGLSKVPSGYDFVFPYISGGKQRYKQVIVLWGGETRQTVCLVRADVTDMLTSERQTQKALESALAQAKEANRAKSDFLSAMSHDIRTPMNAIMGMTALAVAHIDDRARVSDCLQKISVSSKHLLSLINDILDMSKIERSKIALHHMRIALPQFMDQLSTMMAPQARAAGLDFRMRLEGVRHGYFYGDSLRINQILINLLSNAIKFTPSGGRVEFTAEEIPPLQAGQVRYLFTVRDTGVGMTEDFLTRIFEPFFRGRNVSDIEGTGLGLSITKGLTDLMDGKITVESHPDRGTVFQVELEHQIAPDQDSACAAADLTAFSKLSGKNPLAGRRFLVAEDNKINAEILCGLLEMYGAESEVRSDGALTVEAFQTVEPGTYDAILMDILMPCMNGYEAARAIRSLKRPDAKTIPIVAMTANAFAEDVQASVDAGMTAHVAKPVDPELLRTVLTDILEGAKKGPFPQPAEGCHRQGRVKF